MTGARGWRASTVVLALLMALAAVWVGQVLGRRAGAPPGEPPVHDSLDRHPEREATPGRGPPASADRARVLAFWEAYREATAHRLGGRFEEAARAYARALALNAAHEDALYYSGHVQLVLGDFGAALDAWRRLATVNPASARAHLQLGTLYLCFEDGAPTNFALAAQAFRRAHEINKEETGAVLRLGEIALVRNDWGAAARHFENVRQTNPNSVPAHFYLGYLAWNEGRAGEAQELFARAVELAQHEPVPAAPSEGDTKHGLDPLLAQRRRCRDLEDPAAELETVPRNAVSRELTRRYIALRALLREAQRRDQGAQPVP